MMWEGGSSKVVGSQQDEQGGSEQGCCTFHVLQLSEQQRSA